MNSAQVTCPTRPAGRAHRRASLTLVPLVAALIGLVGLSQPAQAQLLGGASGMVGGAGQSSFGSRSLDLGGSGRAQGDSLLRRPAVRPLESVNDKARGAAAASGEGVQAGSDRGARAAAQGAAQAETARGGAAEAGSETRSGTLGAITEARGQATAARSSAADTRGAATDSARNEARQPTRAGLAGNGEASGEVSTQPRRADASGAGGAEVSRGDRSVQAEGAGATSVRRP